MAAETTAVRNDGAVEAAATCDEGVMLESRLIRLLDNFRFFPPTACTLDNFHFFPPIVQSTVVVLFPVTAGTRTAKAKGDNGHAREEV